MYFFQIWNVKSLKLFIVHKPSEWIAIGPLAIKFVQSDLAKVAVHTSDVSWPNNLVKTQSQASSEFFLNSFRWILQIQWIMTKSKTGLATRCGTYLATETLPGRVILRICPLLPLVTILLPLTTLNSYLTREGNGNFFFTTAWGNISVVRYGLSLVTILLWI